MWIQGLHDCIVGGTHDWSYFPMANFLSSKHYYFHVSGYNYVRMDFENDNFHEIFVLGAPAAFFFSKETSMEK